MRADAPAEKALACEDDLGDGDLRDGNAVGAPSRMDGDSELKERTRKALNRAGGVKYVLQIREIAPNFLF